MRAVALALALLVTANAAVAATARLTLSPTKARVGDAIVAELTVEAAAGETVDVAPLPLSWGPAQVLTGSWEPAAPPATSRVWKGTIAVYELGRVTIPELVVPVSTAGGPVAAATAPASVEIEGTLPADAQGAKPPDLVDLKPPASIPPDFGPLKLALTALAGLLAVAGLAWWLWHRYAAKLAAVAAPVDPFRRLPPHVWVYEELEKLLAKRLAEEGKIGQFYDELTHIVKQYLEGRYRVDLLERTTSEVPGALAVAGASADAGTLARALLEAGDRVKFARVAAPPADCRSAVEETYRLVDMTKPAEVQPEPEAAGAAR